LTFRPLNEVTGHSCHGLPFCQFSTYHAIPFSTYIQRGTDRMTDVAINA